MSQEIQRPFLSLVFFDSFEKRGIDFAKFSEDNFFLGEIFTDNKLKRGAMMRTVAEGSIFIKEIVM